MRISPPTNRPTPRITVAIRYAAGQPEERLAVAPWNVAGRRRDEDDGGDGGDCA
jgi:hypothetical protein